MVKTRNSAPIQDKTVVALICPPFQVTSSTEPPFTFTLERERKRISTDLPTITILCFRLSVASKSQFCVRTGHHLITLLLYCCQRPNGNLFSSSLLVFPGSHERPTQTEALIQKHKKPSPTYGTRIPVMHFLPKAHFVLIRPWKMKRPFYLLVFPSQKTCNQPRTFHHEPK